MRLCRRVYKCRKSGAQAASRQMIGGAGARPASDFVEEGRAGEPGKAKGPRIAREPPFTSIATAGVPTDS